jgi:hypothetical protein
MAAHDDDLEPGISQALAQSVDQVDPSTALRDRVLRSVGASATRPLATSRSTSAFPSWLATAALLAIAAGLSVYSFLLRSRITTLEGELRDAILRAERYAARQPTRSRASRC